MDYFYQCGHLKIEYNLIRSLKMSNLANYSPYNKTFKFVMFQNQAYHERNKINAKPCINSNIRYRLSASPSRGDLSSSFIQTDRNDKLAFKCGLPFQTGRSVQNKTLLFTSRNLRQSNPEIYIPKRVIHKNQSYQKFNTRRIMDDNSKLVVRLNSTSCQIINRQKSQKSFKNHLRYRQIRNKYDPSGLRKHALVVGLEDLLCPTLKEYGQSGLASKFVEGDLSWAKSTTSRTRCSIRRSNMSQMS